MRWLKRERGDRGRKRERGKERKKERDGASVCAFVCVCACTCTWECVYGYVCVCVFLCMFMCVCVPSLFWLFLFTHQHKYTQMATTWHTYTCTNKQTYTGADIEQVLLRCVDTVHSKTAALQEPGNCVHMCLRYMSVRVAVCSSVLQSVAVCCGAMCCGVVHCVAVHSSV